MKGAPGAYRGDRPFVFVSYAHADASAVRGEILMLVRHGYRVYYDDDIRPGSRWHDELAQAIDSCAAFVMFVSSHSMESSNCQRELKFALDENKPVLAVYLEEVELPPGLRLAVGDRQAIYKTRLGEADYRQRLASALAQYFDRPAIGAELPTARHRHRVTWLATLSIGLLVLAILVYDAWRPSRDSADVIDAASEALDQDQYGRAFTLLRELTAAQRKDPAVAELFSESVNPMIPVVAEDGASVYFKPYAETDSAWVFAGVTPIETPVEAPKGVLRLRIEKPGFRTGFFTVANPGPSLVTTDVLTEVKRIARIPEVPLVLTREGFIEDDLVLIPRSNYPVYLLGWSRNILGDHQREMATFAVGRHEVTNAEFKPFVDAGGYENDVYWSGLAFEVDGREISLGTARELMVDQTGRPGPAGWEFGSFQEGQGDLPVGGISWYEAVAYARFRGLTLPTAHHWVRAAHAPYEGLFNTAPAVAGLSHFSSDDPRPAKDSKALGPWGTYDTAGNVREWVWNHAENGALVLGGAWSDYAATYQYVYTAAPMDRSPQHGLRLMQLVDQESVPEDLLAPLTLRTDLDASARQPVSDEAFTAMRFQFTAGERNARETTATEVASTDLWIAEEVVLEFDEDRFHLYVVRPRSGREPLQPVIFVPPGDAFAISRPNRAVLAQLRNADYIVKAGRVLVIPIWWLSYQRFEPRPSEREAMRDRQRRAALRWQEDLVTTLGYIDQRKDLDAERVGLLCISYGTSNVAPILLAVEGRLRSAALIAGGVKESDVHPMADPVNYLPRVHQPTLVINGRYDHIFPYEQSQKRYFDLLGTSAERKRHRIYDVGHFAFPGHLLAREVTDWFDETLGPVR